MTPRDLPAVKARLRSSELPALQALAARALAMESAAEVRALDAAPVVEMRERSAA